MGEADSPPAGGAERLAPGQRACTRLGWSQQTGSKCPRATGHQTPQSESLSPHADSSACPTAPGSLHITGAASSSSLPRPQGLLSPTDSGPDLLVHHPSTPEQMHERMPEPVRTRPSLPAWVCQGGTGGAPRLPDTGCAAPARRSLGAAVLAAHGNAKNAAPPAEMAIPVGTAAAQPWRPSPHNPDWEPSWAAPGPPGGHPV